jgi:hypothetical protein
MLHYIVFPYVRNVLHLELFFGTGARWGTRDRTRWGAEDRGGSRSIPFRARGRAGFRAWESNPGFRKGLASGRTHTSDFQALESPITMWLTWQKISASQPWDPWDVREKEGSIFYEKNICEGLNEKNICHASTAHQQINVRMAAWTCCAPLNKFRDSEIHFQSSWTYVTHAYKFEGRWCI